MGKIKQIKKAAAKTKAHAKKDAKKKSTWETKSAKKGTLKSTPKPYVKKATTAETNKKKVDKANRKAKKLLKTPKPAKNKGASAVKCSDAPGWDCGPIKEHCGKPSMAKFCQKTCGACVKLSSSKKRKPKKVQGKAGNKRTQKKTTT